MQLTTLIRSVLVSVACLSGVWAEAPAPGRAATSITLRPKRGACTFFDRPLVRRHFGGNSAEHDARAGCPCLARPDRVSVVRREQRSGCSDQLAFLKLL